DVEGLLRQVVELEHDRAGFSAVCARSGGEVVEGELPVSSSDVGLLAHQACSLVGGLVPLLVVDAATVTAPGLPQTGVPVPDRKELQEPIPTTLPAQLAFAHAANGTGFVR